MNSPIITIGIALSLVGMIAGSAPMAIAESNGTARRPPTTQGVNTTVPLDKVSGIVDWFDSLMDKFDAIEVKESRKQFVRSVKELRTGLYTLEQDSQHFLSQIPDARPSPEKTAKLLKTNTLLLVEVEELIAKKNNIGADIIYNGGTDTEAQTSSRLHRKEMTLDYVEGQLTDTTAVWSAATIRAALARGIEDVRKAQLACNDFQHTLENAPQTKFHG
ncbi:hypothetical protein [Paraburkholderia sp. J8-2]|uniref:hypothetical protein n=1 Tax=Paraburkholderia sp. J8-2 TaxID=2805440 RepID=UPI002AB7B5AD|nr:hypothetical protein [Paraburkholderia sp. J8-2]